MEIGRFLQDFLRYSRDKALFPAGTRVLVAVSGGLDSSVLGHSLARLARILEIDVHFAHVDHGTRGLATRKEGAWVEVLGARLHVTTHLLSLGDDLGSAGQAELRDRRRAALILKASEIGADFIVTAHHADDNAETFLMRAVSGTGARGLAGIPPKEGRWIRPLLWATRGDIEAYARLHGLAWVEDPSNATGKYLRNRVRQDILPGLESLRRGAVRNLARAAERMDEEERELDTWLDGQFETGPRGALPLPQLERWPRPLQRRVVRLWLKRLGIEGEPALVERILSGEDVLHPTGSFFRQSDMILFSRERDFAANWGEGAELEIGRGFELGTSMAWSFLKGAPTKARPTDCKLYFVFRQPERLRAGALALDWSRLPNEGVAIRAAGHDAVAVHAELRAAGVPEPYWKHWPLLVSRGPDGRTIAIVGVRAMDDYALTGPGRCVSLEALFEERLKDVSPA